MNSGWKMLQPYKHHATAKLCTNMALLNMFDWLSKHGLVDALQENCSVDSPPKIQLGEGHWDTRVDDGITFVPPGCRRECSHSLHSMSLSAYRTKQGWNSLPGWDPYQVVARSISRTKQP